MPLSTDNLTVFLATANATAARAFYCGQLGFAAVYEDDFALVLDANGTALRIQKLKKGHATTLHRARVVGKIYQ